MYVHEFQANELLRAYGVNVLKGFSIKSADEVELNYDNIGTPDKVVKAQILAGGRGKAGGIRIVTSIEEAKQATEAFLGSKLVTHQTGPNGQIVKTVYIEEACEIARELYLSIMVDRVNSDIAIIASASGGMEIEAVAKATPEAVVKVNINPLLGIKPFRYIQLAQALNLDLKYLGALSECINGMYRCFIDKDLNLLEINPLVLTNEGKLVALDAKMEFDDNALVRHPDIEGLRDIAAEDEKEILANQHGLAYVSLDGEVGCLVNGAGLAMATMDAIQYAGGSPANFLDVGGSASAESVSKGFEILMTDKKVKGIFVNIFGGIMHCDTIVVGIIKAARKMTRKIPIVVRLEGTNADKGIYLLNSSDLLIETVNSMDDGAKMVMQLIGKRGIQN